MKKIILKLLPVLMLLSEISVFAQTNAKVIRVKDGDTYVLQDSVKTFTVRLLKIDAPEMKQKSGFESYRFVTGLIGGRMVEYTGAKKDKYGRTLASLTINGQRVDSLIIANGWAWHYVNYDNETMLDTLQQQAIRDSLGLWSCGNANVCPPWLYRGYNAKNRIRYCKGCSL